MSLVMKDAYDMFSFLYLYIYECTTTIQYEFKFSLIELIYNVRCTIDVPRDNEVVTYVR